MTGNKNAIITGARTGIGLACLRVFAKDGYNCWAVVHREDTVFLAECRSLESEFGVWIKPVYMDLSRSEDIAKGMKLILNEKLTIDVLVNAAGVVSPSRLFTMTPMGDIRTVMEVNFFAALEMIQWACKAMTKRRRGSIVNVSSVSAYGDDSAQMEYASSKAALICATKKLGRELGHYGIRVNAVAPGLTETKMLDAFNKEIIRDMVAGSGLRRTGRPEEIADVILFLASEKASFVTGETIIVSGG